MSTERNKERVRQLLDVAFTRGLPVPEKRAVMATLINSEKYIQHSAVVPDGFDGLMDLVSNLDDEFEDYAIDIKRLIAEEDFVWAHCHYRFGTAVPNEKAIVEIFRFENGMMVEHWDVIQDVPDSFANKNGMF